MELIPRNKCLWVENLFDKDVVCGITLDAVFSKNMHSLSDVFSQAGHHPELIWMKQVHSAEVKIVGSAGEYDCDGVFSNAKNKLMIVRTADCLPLIFHSKEPRVSGVIHMGWRSAAAGILDNIPYDLGSFKVILGPGLRKCCYQLGEEFSRFALFKEHLTVLGRRVYFDPVGFAREKLSEKGIKEDNIFDINICTFCSGASFFSYRKTLTGDRNLSFIFNRA